MAGLKKNSDFTVKFRYCFTNQRLDVNDCKVKLDKK